MHRWTKIILKNKAQREEQLSKRNAHTNTKSSREHTETAETAAQEKSIRDIAQGSIPRKFIQKRPILKMGNTIALSL